MKNRTWLLCLVAILAILMLSACAKDGDSKGSESQSPGNETSTPQHSGNEKLPEQKEEAPKMELSEKTEITVYYMWGGYPEDMFMNDLGRHIIKRHPNLTINYIQNEGDNSVANLIASKTNLDMILTTDGAYSFLQQHGIEGNISDLIKKYNYDINQLHPSVYEVMKVINDGVNAPGLPYKVNSMGFFYNKDLFDKFGVDYLTDGMTWDEIYEVARVMTRSEGGVMYRGLGFRNANFIGMNQLSLRVADPVAKKAAFDSDDWKSYLQNFIRFLQLPGYDVTKDTVIGAVPYDQFIKDQTLAMLVQMNSDWPREELGISMNWDAITYPEFPSRPGVGPQANVVFFVIPDTAKNRDSAFLAVTALIEKEAQIEMAKIGSAPVVTDPSIMEVYGTESPDLKTRNARALIPTDYAMTTVSELTNITNSHAYGAFRDVATGEKDINTALRDAIEAANKAIEEYYAAR